MTAEAAPTDSDRTSPSPHDGHASPLTASPSTQMPHAPPSADVPQPHTLDSTSTHETEHHMGDLNTSMAGEADGSTVLQETTMVDGGDDDEAEQRGDPGERRVSLTSQKRYSGNGVANEVAQGRMDQGQEDEADIADWDPLRQTMRPASGDVNQTQDLTMVVEEEVGDELVDSNGRVLFTDSNAKPSPAGSRRASHLRLNIKPPSPQPWDLIDPPPSDNGHKGNHDFYSTSGSRKFHTLQSTT